MKFIRRHLFACGPEQQSPSPEVACVRIADPLTACGMAVDVFVHERPTRRIELRLLGDLVDIEERIVADELAFRVGRRRLPPARPHRIIMIDARPFDVVASGIGGFPGAVGLAVVSPKREVRTKFGWHGGIAPLAPMVDRLLRRLLTGRV